MSKKPTYTPKKDSPSTASGKQKVAWQGYVNWSLSDAHKKAFNEWLLSKPDLDVLIVKAAMDGYDLKVRYDDYNECMSAQLYCTNAKNPNAGWCLSMRGNDWWKAVQRVLYVHYIALQEAWSAQVEKGWNDENW